MKGGIEGAGVTPSPKAEADPTQYSELAPSEALSFVRKKGSVEIYTDGEHEYVKIDDFGERQQMIAMMLKGIVNVADVVAIDTEHGRSFYSKVLEHERIQERAEANSIVADIALLANVIGDTDRAFETRYASKDKEHANLIVKDGAVSYFDFERAEFNSPLNSHNDLELTIVNPELLGSLLKKLDRMEDRFAGSAGLEFLQAVVSRTGKTLSELFPRTPGSESVEAFQQMLLGRIARVRELATERLGTLAS